MLSGAHGAELEAELFEAARERPNKVGGGPVFIVGAPRTGSTIFYQALVSAYDLPYFSNLTDKYFAERPIIGLSLQGGIPLPSLISGRSRFGKTEGSRQPSEASRVMTAWFGGGHPSEVRSAGASPGNEEHLCRTIDAAHRLFGRPLVIKNAWNCFRLRFLRATFPEAAFIWIRRGMVASAQSDLDARYVVSGNPLVWNSATPRNWEELRVRPCWEQVAENQFEFSRAIGEGLDGLQPTRRADVWYEDLCEEPEVVLHSLGEQLSVLFHVEFQPARIPPIESAPIGGGLEAREIRAVEHYIADNEARFGPLRHPPRSGGSSRDNVVTGRKRSAGRDAVMKRCGRSELQAYMAEDRIATLLADCVQAGDEILASQKWLADSPAKRFLFDEIYGDLLERSGLRVLDVGGGLTSLTRRVAKGHRYELIDFFAHDGPATVAAFLSSAPDLTIQEADWAEANFEASYDIVVANDVFPNVDQRLVPFLERTLPVCRELRMSLTYYNEPRCYRARRVGADEILSVLAWNGTMLSHAIAPYLARIERPDTSVFEADDDWIFPNRRQICLVTLNGDLA